MLVGHRIIPLLARDRREMEREAYQRKRVGSAIRNPARSWRVLSHSRIAKESSSGYCLLEIPRGVGELAREWGAPSHSRRNTCLHRANEPVFHRQGGRRFFRLDAPQGSANPRMGVRILCRKTGRCGRHSETIGGG